MEIASLQSVRFVGLWDRETSTGARMGGHYSQMLLEKAARRGNVDSRGPAAYSTFHRRVGTPRGVTDAGFTSHVMLPREPIYASTRGFITSVDSGAWDGRQRCSRFKNLGVTYDQLRSSRVSIDSGIGFNNNHAVLYSGCFSIKRYQLRV